ncbi:hypothetical protein IE53DRAFT_149557 [Violaceomyces palustris]|uniref:Uncharacterized protein n=1 Tax=Violaceomyces palustris TaxID=1673888 RepID=A0ACD0P6D5_9BASI|nr:hypothetical protein IE53DRAFT_149557 [Violaceomyces palustris]
MASSPSPQPVTKKIKVKAKLDHCPLQKVFARYSTFYRSGASTKPAMAPIPLKNSSSADLKGRQAAQAVPPLIREPGPSRIVHEALTSSARVLKAAADENHGKTTTSSKKKKTATSPPTGSNIIVNLCSESDSDRELPQNLAELKNSRIKGKGRAKDPDAGLCRQQKHSDDKARTSMEAVDFSQEELDLHLNAIKEKKAGKARAQDTCRRRGKSMLSAAGAGGDNEENGVIVMIGTGNDQVERDCDKHVLDGFPSGKTLDECLQVLLGIFPDMDEGYGKSKLEESFRPGQTSQKLLATTCQILLDGTDGYLKGKKRKAMTQDPSSESSEDECEPRGSNYYEKPLTFVSRKGKMVHQWASVKLLQAEFPHFPLKYLKDLLASNKLSYACTRLEILKMDLFPDRVPSGSTVKGKCKPHAFKPKESGKSHSQSADDNPKGTSFVEWVTGLADLPKDLKSEALWVHGKEGECC